MHVVGPGVPIDIGVVDDGVGNRLGDDPFHDLLNDSLLGEAGLAVRIVRFDLVAQVPMREQTQLGGKQTMPLLVEQVVHPNVVLRDVLRGFGGRFGDGEVDGSRDAFSEALRQTRLCPLAARPALALRQSLLESRQREVQKDREGELVREEVVDDVRGRVVAGEDFVEWIDRAQLEIRLSTKIPIDLQHVAVQGLQSEFHAGEKRVLSLLVAREMNSDELLEVGGVPVLRPPEFFDLL